MEEEARRRCHAGNLRRQAYEGRQRREKETKNKIKVGKDESGKSVLAQAKG